MNFRGVKLLTHTNWLKNGAIHQHIDCAWWNNKPKDHTLDTVSEKGISNEHQ